MVQPSGEPRGVVKQLAVVATTPPLGGDEIKADAPAPDRGRLAVGAADLCSLVGAPTHGSHHRAACHVLLLFRPPTLPTHPRVDEIFPPAMLLYQHRKQ